MLEKFIATNFEHIFTPFYILLYYILQYQNMTIFYSLFLNLSEVKNLVGNLTYSQTKFVYLRILILKSVKNILSLIKPSEFSKINYHDFFSNFTPSLRTYFNLNWIYFSYFSRTTTIPSPVPFVNATLYRNCTQIVYIQNIFTQQRIVQSLHQPFCLLWIFNLLPGSSQVHYPIPNFTSIW